MAFQRLAKYLSGVEGLEVEADIARRSLQSGVVRPEKAMRQEAGRKEMGVHPPYSTSPKAPLLDEPENFVVSGGNGARQRVEIAQHTRAISQISARKLPYDERVHKHDTLVEEFSKQGLAFPQVRDPEGGIGKNRHLAGRRRRGMGRSFGCVPPRAARRLPASRAISASKPARTKAVFS